jgi:hypothetical protein
MHGGRDSTQGSTRGRVRRDGNFWLDCARAAGAVTALAGCSNDIQACPDLFDTWVDVPSGTFAPAEARHVEFMEGLPSFAPTFPRGTIDPTIAADTAISGGLPPYDASAYSAPPQAVPSAAITVDHTLGIVTRSYTDVQGHFVQERWRVRGTP